MVASAPPCRTFCPKDLAVAEWSQLEPLYKSLLARSPNSPAELEQWLKDVSELSSVVDEYGSRRYIDKSCHTDDPAVEARYLQFVEQVEPRVKPLYFRLQQKLLSAPAATLLDPARYGVMLRRWRADVELFREENVALETEVTKTVNEYDKISGAMTVSFRGAEYTMQQMARFLEEPDRPTREEAWRATADRRLRDREPVEAIFERLLPLRNRIAAN